MTNQASPRVILRCGGCGDPVERSVRRASELRRTGKTPICRTCMNPPRVEVTPELVAWWRDRLSGDELCKLAGAIEP